MHQLRAELHSEFSASVDNAVDRVSQSFLSRLDEVKNDVDTVKSELKHIEVRADALEKDADEKIDMLQKEIAA